jgi:hypothetical protein
MLLDLFDVPVDERDRYIDAAEVANQQGWWEQWGDEDLPRVERRYVGLEDGAIRLRAYLPSIIHGLLQTPEYTRGILRAFRTIIPEERIIRLVELRQARQEALTREVGPLQVHLVLDEAAVRRQVGSRRTMDAQLAHVAEIAGRLQNLTVQIMPFGAGAHGAHFGPFSILEFPWADDSGLVFIEGLVEPRYIEARADIYRHSSLFDRLVEMALSADESIELLRSLIDA